MESKSASPTYVGKPLLRKEDYRLLTGRAKFVADLRLPGMVEAAILRSRHAHARIRRISTESAERVPGVLAVFTAADLEGRVEPFTRLFYKDVAPTLQEQVQPEIKPHRAPVLAADKVNRVGEPLAVVVAENRYVAEDALERIEVAYDPLPVVTDPEAALRPESPIIHPELGDNVHCRFQVTVGDPHRTLAEAEETITERFRVHREIGSPMETRGILAQFEAYRNQLTIWMTTQIPHLVRTYLAEMLHLSENDIRVIVPDMGGSFGGNVYNEDILIPFLAMQLGRPVRWIEDRQENLANARHARDQIHEVTIGFQRDGKILALKDRLILDCGCYNPFSLAMAYNTVAHMRGQYAIAHFHAEAACVMTNKTPNTPIRGAGRPEAAFVMDRLMDMIADRLQMDPAEVRRRNIIPAEAMPYDMGMLYRDGRPVIYDSGDFPTQLEMVLAAADYRGLRKQQERWRRQGRRIGIGLSSGVEGTGYGPHEGAIVRVDPSGDVMVFAGCTPHGQGLETTLAQVCADVLQVNPDRVTVRTGDTGLIPFGGGTFASRSAVTAGTAVQMAANRLREKILKLASRVLEVHPDDVVLQDGRVFPKGAPAKAIELGDLARMAAPGPGSRIPEDMEPGLESRYYFVPPTVTYASSNHLAVVEVDEETGRVELLRYLIAHDCGKVLNPLVVEGQIRGAVVQGIGGAMFEEAVYDADGQFLTASFMDYLLPVSSEVPPVEILHQEFLSTRNPLGIKGCGEGGTTSPPAAIANAIVDAMRPLPIHLTELPLKPERIWRVIQKAKTAMPKGS